ncbi:alanine racemase [Escherichia coli]|uniref:Alanine racemase, biosynthetic n=1 Tax=Escherichia coli TaxID=562 RepID=A0A377B727_ECOLX|nr:alanine racemase [Escherichia coli]
MNIVSHFARADEQNVAQPRNNSLSLIPFAKANLVNVPLPHRVAFCCGHSPHFDWVRPGIILYGVSPLEDRSTGADFGCQPVMSLTSSLIAVREHKAGEPVGYGEPG